MPKNTERRHSAVESIRAAALELFVERGYAETSLRDIGAMAGYTPGNIYHYFPTKRAIALDIAETLSAQLAKEEHWILERSQGTRDQIYSLLRGFFEWSVANPHAAMFMYGFFDLRILTDDNSLPHLRVVPKQVVIELIVRGQQRGEVRAGDPARLYLSTTIALEVLRLYFGGRLDKASYLGMVDDVSEMVWRSLRA